MDHGSIELWIRRGVVRGPRVDGRAEQLDNEQRVPVCSQRHGLPVMVSGSGSAEGTGKQFGWSGLEVTKEAGVSSLFPVGRVVEIDSRA